MDKDLLKAFVAGQVRHSLTVVAGALMAHGAFATAGDQSQFVQVGSGIVMWAIVGLWSWWQKSGQEQVRAALKRITNRGTTASAVAVANTVKPVAALLLAIGLSLLLAPTPGHAQLRKPALTGNVVNDISTDLKGGATAQPTVAGVRLTGNLAVDGPKIWAAIMAASNADLSYASALAGAAGTPAAKTRKQCWDAIIAVNAQASGSTLLGSDGKTPLQRPDPALISNVESMAELIDNLSPQGTLFTSCAGAATMAKQSVLQLVMGMVTGAAAFTAVGG